MIQRQFISYEEAESIILHAQETVRQSVPGMADQMDSAVSEAIAILASTAITGSFQGQFDSNAGILKPSRVIATRMIHATYPYVKYRCDHIDGSPRPLMFSCDPPFICCKDCFSTLELRVFNWNNQCDSCGQFVLMMTPVLLNLGPVMIHGHLCDSCSDIANNR